MSLSQTNSIKKNEISKIAACHRIEGFSSMPAYRMIQTNPSHPPGGIRGCPIPLVGLPPTEPGSICFRLQPLGGPDWCRSLLDCTCM